MKFETKPSFKFSLRLKDSDVAVLRDAEASGKKISGVRVKIEATHSGIINGNSWFYLPKGMKSGTSSFVKPFKKPVLVQHNRDDDPIGRVEKAKYVDYKINTDLMDSSDPIKMYDEVINFVNSKEFKRKDYKGLGHIELIVNITDEEAIQKVLDKRYLTVSISGSSDKAVCSGCGTDLKNMDSIIQYREEGGECPHFRGETFKDKEIFFIGGVMDFNEVSYVNTPADPNATSEVISDSDGFLQLTEDLEIVDFEYVNENTDENITGENDKMKLEDLLKDEALLTKIHDKMKELGLESYILSDERLEKLRKTSFLFAEERAFPVKDKAYIIAAQAILDDVEDSEELEEAKGILDGKFERSFGKDVSFEDAVEGLVNDIEDEEEEETQTPVQLELDYDKIADAIVAKLKNLVDLSDFAKSRSESLERENEALVSENEQYEDTLRQVIVDQILSLEDKDEDEDYKARLENRTIQSLRDKLEDLKSNGVDAEDDSEEDDEEGIQDSEVDIDDAADADGEIDDEEVDTDTDTGEKLDIEDIRTQYSKVLRTKGLSAASKYLRDLREEKKLPENFKFNR